MNSANTILIVDDSPTNLQLIVDQLEEHGYLVLVAEDGEEGVQRAAFTLPDLILLDVKLPGIDGFEACRQLKSNPQTRDIPVIFMTILDDARDKVAGFAAGGVDYITKPFQTSEVLARVCTHLALRAYENQLQHQNSLLQHEVKVRQIAESQLQHQATHDTLTNLPNRALLINLLQQTLASAQRNKRIFVLCFIDLDHFKSINDNLGHAAGDTLLKTVACRIAGCLRGSDTVARIGGDEFVLLLRDLDEIKQALQTIARVIGAVSQNMQLGGQQVSITCSIGCSAYPDDSDNASDLLKFADCAMYRAKQAGRNQMQLYNAELRQQLAERDHLVADLRFAISRQELQLYYQAQFDLISDQIVGVAAMLCWPHPKLGLIDFDRLIALAEETGLIEEIGPWFLQQACVQAVKWQLHNQAPLKLTLKLSARQLLRGDIAGLLSRTLTATGLAPRCLELEVSEMVAMTEPQQVLVLMQQLKSMGFSVALANFGRGYSNMPYLSRFPIERLKLDACLIQDLDKDTRCLAMVDGLIQLAHRLGLQVVAELVERESQRQLLSDLHCDQIQDYRNKLALDPLLFVAQFDPLADFSRVQNQALVEEDIFAKE